MPEDGHEKFALKFAATALGFLLIDGPYKMNEAISKVAIDAVARAEVHIRQMAEADGITVESEFTVAEVIEWTSKVFDAVTKERLGAPKRGRPKKLTKVRLEQAIEDRQKRGQPRVVKGLAMDLDQKESTVRKTLKRFEINYGEAD